MSDRVAIISDGTRWFVRRIRVSEHDMANDEMVYRCNEPLANDLRSLDDAVLIVKAYRRARKPWKTRWLAHGKGPRR